MNNTTTSKALTSGVFQVGVMVSDVDECLKLFRDTLGMKVVFDARNQIQPAHGLSGCARQVMNCLMLKGQDGAFLEIHQYVSPPARPHPPLEHRDIGSMHFMMKVNDIYQTLSQVEKLGYKPMNDVVTRKDGFKFTYFRGPDGVMIELHEGEMIPNEYNKNV